MNSSLEPSILMLSLLVSQATGLPPYRKLGKRWVVSQVAQRLHDLDGALVKLESEGMVEVRRGPGAVWFRLSHRGLAFGSMVDSEFAMKELVRYLGMGGAC